MNQMCESLDLADDTASPLLNRKFNRMAHPVQVRSHATDKHLITPPQASAPFLNCIP